MTVSADKKNGVLNGRWRVELQKGNERYRQRHDTHAAAVADEARVKALWAAGEGALGAARAVKAPKAHTITSVSQEASGTLWRGSTGEASAWAHIRVLGEIIGAELSIDEIETPHLTKAIRELGKLGKSDATINRYLSHFRTFLNWAVDEGFRKVPVAALKFRWQKESAGRIRWITPVEEKLLKKHLPKNVWMLVKVAIETGCRRDELLTLEPQDVNGNLLHLWVTKTDSPRTVPLSDETTSMLRYLLQGSNMPTRRGLRSWWGRAKSAMKLDHDDQFVFHVCRHTCATRLVDQGENLLVIKEWMGHKRIETTQRYAHVKPSNLQEALLRRGTSGSPTTTQPQISANDGGPPPSPTGGVNELDEGREAA